MKSMRFQKSCAAAALSLCLLLALFTPAQAWGKRAADQPAVSAFAKSDQQSCVICFTREDFLSRTRGKEELSSIVIASLPEEGSLCLAGRPLQCGEAVSTDMLSALAYFPGSDQELHTRFSFLPVFSESGAGETAVTVSLNSSDRQNSPPVAVDLHYETYADLTLCGTLKAVDPDGDPCSFEIISQGRRGTAEITETGFRYQAGGKSGRDSFTYVAVDPCGERSAEATVTVTVSKRAAKECFTYTDMAESTCHYAALKLREAGVFSGETLGAEAFFCPDKPVTRAEFLALAASVSELPLPTAAVSTGLADDEDIPVWAQSYVAAAISVGAVEGERDGLGNRVFSASRPITRGEAAAILTRLLALPRDGRQSAFADSESIPDWAAQPLCSANAAGILPVFADGTIRCSQVVTREDAAVMLYQALRYRQTERERY